jgi:hypothetical protein
MARIRTIKPEFWKHEDLSALPEATHILAAALLNYADDFGYFNANPALVKAECSPLREPSVSIPESLRSLQEAGYIEVGTCPKGRRYGRVVNFRGHQKVSHPTESKIACLSITWDDSGSSPENIGNAPDTFGPEQGTGNREQGTGNREAGSGEPDAAAAASSRSQPLVTLQGYIDRRKAEGQKPIPKDHKVFEYAEAAGIPENFLTLAWHEFRGRYTASPDNRKKYRDWPGVFLKAVKGNWLKVWYVDAGAYKLTTVGQQAEMVRGNNVH